MFLLLIFFSSSSCSTKLSDSFVVYGASILLDSDKLGLMEKMVVSRKLTDNVPTNLTDKVLNEDS